MSQGKIIVRTAEGRRELLCKIRKKWLLITPEELVRQQFVGYLLELGFSNGQISLEQSFSLDWGKQLRADIVVYSRSGVPLILIECKAPTIELSQDVFTQASKYNSSFKAKYIALTNGQNSMLFTSDDLINYRKIELKELSKLSIL